MDLYGIGFANIRLADDGIFTLYSYNSRINTFPEETFIHEFIHTLERTSREYGYDTVDLHKYEEYGYTEQRLVSLKQWYQDYMRCEIEDPQTNQYVGLNENVYKLKPAHKSDFDFAVEVDFNDEPSNIFEEIGALFNVVIEAI